MVDCEINTLPLHTPKGRKGSPFFFKVNNLGETRGSIRAPLFLFELFLDVLWILGAQPALLGSAFVHVHDIATSANIDELSAGLYGGIGWQLNGTAVAGFLVCIGGDQWRAQIALLYGSATPNKIKSRTYNGGWTAWKDL